jgi:hypothetical protein
MVVHDYDRKFILPLFMMKVSQFFISHCNHTHVEIEQIYDVYYLVVKLQMKRQHMPYW